MFKWHLSPNNWHSKWTHVIILNIAINCTHNYICNLLQECISMKMYIYTCQLSYVACDCKSATTCLTQICQMQLHVACVIGV